MVRRIVTGNNPDGKSGIVADEILTDMVLWRSDEFAPPIILPSTAPEIEPPPGGSKCARVTLPPWAALREAMEAGRIPGHDRNGFHRTETIDAIMMISGEVTLLLDEGEATLVAGDLVIQRNTLHAWHVRGDIPAEFWGVMVSLVKETR
jgi:quercetin dioxygenase-like cupin family protein